MTMGYPSRYLVVGGVLPHKERSSLQLHTIEASLQLASLSTGGRHPNAATTSAFGKLRKPPTTIPCLWLAWKGKRGILGAWTFF